MDSRLIKMNTFLSDIFLTAQKCVNKKPGKKSFSHTSCEKNYRKKSCIVFSIEKFFSTNKLFLLLHDVSLKVAVFSECTF